MLSSRQFRLTVLCAALSACATGTTTNAGVCPSRDAQLHHVELSDGKPEELAILIPDEAGDRAGYWRLDYVYDAGRTVTVKCKYADVHQVDVPLTQRVTRCDYRIGVNQTLFLSCR